MPGRNATTLSGPKAEGGSFDRLLDCEYDLELPFIDFMDEAVAAGWNRAEVAIAITNLADNYLLGRVTSAQTAQAIRDAVANARKS